MRESLGTGSSSGGGQTAVLPVTERIQREQNVEFLRAESVERAESGKVTGKVEPPLRDDSAFIRKEDSRLECSWCKRVITEGVEPVRHTICPTCHEAMRPTRAA